MKVSLIVPVHNAYKYVKKALESVLINFDFETGEVLIVDDCSDTKTARYLKKFVERHRQFKLIRNEVCLGYLKSCNLAVGHVNGDIVVLLNSDCEIPEHFCRNVAACFTSDSNIAAASPVASKSAYYYLPQILPFKLMNLLFEKRRGPQYPDIFNAEGFCLCVRKSYVDEYGLFDTIYEKGYCEEVDFSLAARSRGRRCVLIDNLYVLHRKNKSFKAARAVALSKNNRILYQRWGKFFHKLDCSLPDNTMENLVADVFGKFKGYILFLKKLNKQFESNRIMTLKNLIKCKSLSAINKKVVYTVIAGRCDIMPVLHDYINYEWDYVCFTDNKTLLKLKTFGAWKILPFAYSTLDDTRNARWHKTHPFLLFPKYDESLWIDANVNILTPYIFDIIEHSSKSLLIPEHYCRSSIYEEAEAVSFLQKDTQENISAMLNLVKNSDMPDNFGLNETNIIYRKHSGDINKLMDEWWYYIENYSKRDQLSLSYVLWKNQVKIEDISIPNARIDDKNFKVFSHNPERTITGKILSFIFR